MFEVVPATHSLVIMFKNDFIVAQEDRIARLNKWILLLHSLDRKLLFSSYFFFDTF